MIQMLIQAPKGLKAVYIAPTKVWGPWEKLRRVFNVLQTRLSVVSASEIGAPSLKESVSNVRAALH